MTGNMEAGQIAAREMLAMLSEQGNADQDPLEVGILLPSDSSQAMVNRVSGFLEYWAKYAPEKWTINQDIRLNGGDMENAQADVSELLSRNNRHIKGLYGCNNTSTKGIAAVLMRAARKDIVMAGFDLAEEAFASLIQGSGLLMASPFCRNRSRWHIRECFPWTSRSGGKREHKYIDTGVLLVDRDATFWRTSRMSDRRKKTKKRKTISCHISVSLSAHHPSGLFSAEPDGPGLQHPAPGTDHRALCRENE